MIKGDAPAATVGIYAALAYDIMSATNSSPQTTELFAGDRHDTLMKWVKIGGWQIVAFGIFGSVLDQTAWPIVGCALGGSIMYAMYIHADKAGQGTAPPASASKPNPQLSGV